MENRGRGIWMKLLYINLWVFKSWVLSVIYGKYKYFINHPREDYRKYLTIQGYNHKLCHKVIMGLAFLSYKTVNIIYGKFQILCGKFCQNWQKCWKGLGWLLALAMYGSHALFMRSAKTEFFSHIYRFLIVNSSNKIRGKYLV